MDKNRKMLLTIGREFGSEGHEIGRMLAERLGIEIFDKDLLYKVAEQSGIAADELARVDEKKSNRWLQPYLAFGYSYGSLDDKLFQLQTQLINEWADRGNCIIVGRLGDYILREDPDCLKIFIYAPFEERVAIISNKHGLTPERARRLVKRMDATREQYYHYYTKGKWNVKEGKDILLNRATFGIEGCVDILEETVKSRLC